MVDLRIELLSKGEALPSGLLPVIADAERAISSLPDEKERKRNAERLDLIKQGASDSIVIRDGQKPVCIIAYHTIDNEITLRFGHLLPDYEQEGEAIVALSVSSLTSRGLKSVMGIFNWPEEELFSKVAEAIGFTRVDRLDMVREHDAISIHRASPPDIAIVPWSPHHLNEAARILHENAFPMDRLFHKPYRTREGCLAYLSAVLQHRYGQYLPECSFVACQGDRQVGQLLATRFPNIGICIVDLAVDEAFRGRGVASSLIGHLIEANAAASGEDIVLTVTRSNSLAFNLYRNMGFQVTASPRYYVFDAEEHGHI
jgi:ribosomal protein S18 acetylase RimI-like enzyme